MSHCIIILFDFSLCDMVIPVREGKRIPVVGHYPNLETCEMKEISFKKKYELTTPFLGADSKLHILPNQFFGCPHREFLNL